VVTRKKYKTASFFEFSKYAKKSEIYVFSLRIISEFQYGDVTITSSIDIKYGDDAVESIP